MTPEALAALHHRCFDSSPPPWSAASFRAILDGADSFLISAPDGFALGRTSADEAELLTLAVAPEARRRGVARAILSRFDAMARARGAALAFLEVAADNTAARTLYEAFGWCEVGRRPRYYDGRIDALVLRRTLSQADAAGSGDTQPSALTTDSG